MDGNKIIYEEVFYLFIYPPTHPNLFSITFFHLFYPPLPHTYIKCKNKFHVNPTKTEEKYKKKNKQKHPTSRKIWKHLRENHVDFEAAAPPSEAKPQVDEEKPNQKTKNKFKKQKTILLMYYYN